MIARYRHLFLSPSGRINRAQFIAALLAWLAFYMAQVFWFANTGSNQFNFILALVLLFLNLYMVFCIYGKRLHDIGRSMWGVMGMVVLVLISAIVVMLNFGGLEYFETLNQNPEIGQDAEAMKKVHETYQASLAKNLPQSRLIMSIIPILFTLWLMIKPGQAVNNKYGETRNPL